MPTPEFLREIEALHVQGTPFCTVRIVDGAGSIPQVVGAKAIFTQDGLYSGTVGGGQLEAKCQEKAIELLSSATTDHYFQRWNLQKDVGMTCGGEAALYFEVYSPEAVWHIVVFGAGHVSQKLCRFLVELDCAVTCVDTRADWLEKLPNSPRLETVLVADYRDGVSRIGPGSYVILMTMGHHSDLPVLQQIEADRPELPYLGVIGSDVKSRLLKKELRDAGAAPQFIDRIVCPIGDGVGENTPPEIAVSVVSQLLKLRRA
jgi:xanthine dehydrogenase accessory factor